MAGSHSNKVASPNLYKAFFDDATLSDLTVRLSDRTVRVHRIVLCRKSEYFTKLLTGHFKESGAKEVEFQEDDPESMVALLRQIYDLPYHEPFGDRRTQLQPHAMVYIVADKYQVTSLQVAASKSIKRIIDYGLNLGVNDADASIQDFVNALHIITTAISRGDDYIRKAMAETCVLNLRYLHQRPEFLSLLLGSPGLGVEIIGHNDLECGLSGEWVCNSGCDNPCLMLCNHCEEPFGNAFARENRDEVAWECETCGRLDNPTCAECHTDVVWLRRGL